MERVTTTSSTCRARVMASHALSPRRDRQRRPVTPAVRRPMSLVTVSPGGDMLGELLERTTRGARLAALITVALVAGFGVATAVGAPGPARLATVVAGDQGSATDDTADAADSATGTAKPEKTGKPEKTSKPAKTDQPEKSDEAGTAGADPAGGAHGACVAKVAQDASKVGGPHHNHGWAVSRAAHTCPHTTPTSAGG